MIEIVIITHGLFGEELYQAAELILGKQGNVRCLSVLPGKAMTEVVEELDNITKKAGDKGVVVFTDMFGGSPSNVAFSYAGNKDVEVVSGVNLPMLLKAFSGRLSGEKLRELACASRDAGVASIKVAGEMIKK